MAALKRSQVGLFVIRPTILPTPEDNANPFITQGPDGRVVIVSLGSLRIIIGFGPSRSSHRVVGEFVERLSQKFRASTPHMHVVRLAAFLGYRGNAAETLHLLGRCKPLPLGAEGHDQSRRQYRPRSRQRAEQTPFRMACHQLGYAPVIFLDLVGYAPYSTQEIAFRRNRRYLK